MLLLDRAAVNPNLFLTADLGPRDAPERTPSPWSGRQGDSENSLYFEGRNGDLVVREPLILGILSGESPFTEADAAFTTAKDRTRAMKVHLAFSGREGRRRKEQPG